MHRSLVTLVRRARPSLERFHGVRIQHYSESFSQRYRSRSTSRLTPTTLIVGFIPILTFALGTWQVKRLRWKLDLIEKIEHQTHHEPLELPDIVNPDILSEFTYRKFFAKGKWDHAHSILVGPRTRDGVNGYHLITPLVRAGGSTILVDRGFISKEFMSLSHDLRKLNQPQGEVAIQGMLRSQPKKNIFTPQNNPAKGEWYYLDIEGINEWVDGEERGIQSLYMEELFEGHSGEAATLISRGVPVGRPGKIELRNMHATYALTWYSLSAATTIMFVRLLRRPHPFTWRVRH